MLSNDVACHGLRAAFMNEKPSNLLICGANRAFVYFNWQCDVKTEIAKRQQGENKENWAKVSKRG